jgi:ArsR family transcriptional regulator
MKTAIQLMKALADETRLRAAKALLDADWCVCELSDALEVEQSNLSRHLAALRHAGVVDMRKDGTWIYYSIARDEKPRVRKLLAALGDVEDERTKLDAVRLKKRRAMREDGRCCLGYGELPKSKKGKRCC